MKTVLIVGGAGYIGSHMVKKLATQNYQIIILDNSDNCIICDGKTVKHINGDLGDITVLDNIFLNYKIDAVMHFAAFIEVGESVIDPAKYYTNNVSKVINLLNAMIKYNVKFFVFSSTAAVFGEPVCEKISESHPKNPINPYGMTKLIIENILADYEKAYGLKYAILRYFNASGADDSGEIGEKHDPETHLIPLVLQAALGIRDSIKVFGSNYKTRDGSCIRDFVHVNDLVDAHLLAMENILINNASNDFNLGSGEGFSVFEVINKAKEVTKADFKVEIAERRNGDPAVLVANSEKANRVLSWKPRYSLAAIIETAWKWEKKRY